VQARSYTDPSRSAPQAGLIQAQLPVATPRLMRHRRTDILTSFDE